MKFTLDVFPGRYKLSGEKLNKLYNYEKQKITPQGGNKQLGLKLGTMKKLAK